MQDNTVIPSITVDPITDDNIINLKESSGHDPIITLTGSWSDPKYDVTISVHVNGQTYTVDNGLLVSKDGTWFLNVQASDFLEGGNNSVTAKIINQLGGQNIATQSVEVDTQPPTVTVVVTKDVEATENIAKAIFEFDKEISNKSFTVENIIINGGVLKPETLQRNSDGTWTVDIEYDKGQPLDVSVNTESYKDKAGNIANAIDDELITLKIESVVPSKENNTSVTIITGQTSAPKQKVVVSLEVIEDDITRTKEIEVISNTDGSWSVTTNETLKEGVPVIAVVKDSDKVSLDQDEFVVPLVVIDVIAKDDVINIQEHAEYREKNVVEITGKLNNSNYPKAALVVTVNDQEYVQGVNSKLTVNEVDGTWTLALPYSEALFTDQDIDVKAYFVDPDKLDSSGKPSIVSNVAERTPEVDIIAPKVKDISISENGIITVQYDSDVDPKSIQSDNIKVTNNKGEVISLEFSVSGDGLTYTAKVPENMDQSISVNVGNGFKDYANNNGEQKSILNQKVETVAPTVIVTLNDDNTVTFKFSEKVKDFTESDVYLSQGQIIDLQQDIKDPTVWAAKIEGRVTDKSLKVSVNDESYTDLAGNLGIGDSDTSDPAYWVKDDNGHSITVKTGLKSEYWGYREGAKYDGPNLTSLKQVQDFMSTHAPTVTFETKAFDFELSNYGLGQAGRTKDQNHLITFLGKNAENIEYKGYQNTSDAMIKFTGYMNLNAGSYIFRVTGDDGYQIKVNGKAIVIKDGNQNAKTDYFLVTVTEEDAGWQPVEIYYWDQAERATLKIELAEIASSVDSEKLNESLNGKTQNQNTEILKAVNIVDKFVILGSSENQFVQQNPLIMKAGQNLKITFDDVLSNDPAYLENGFKLVGVDAGNTGNTISVDYETGIITFSPAADYVGDAIFTYTVSDGKGGRATANVTVEVQNEAYHDLILSEESLAKLLSQTGETEALLEDHFKLGIKQNIDVSRLLGDFATESNLHDYIFIEYDSEKNIATISLDRDGKGELDSNGELKDIYDKQELLVLTNQKQAFDLDDLLANNQIVY
ncbi:Ig-like domain-containing protein [Acinetobacter portensis]|uniref:Ig-like domain-containing protein n=1 Tax=Acinetobacter portensis TaxID=1839785 RepID=UPI0013D12A8A|nr:Ig-like domain-containing protein [Acinetobacter portensis]